MGAVECLPLYGALPYDQQQRAIASSDEGDTAMRPRRVIVSSPIAEASLTLPRVSAVVDSGLRRVPTFDSGSGLSGVSAMAYFILLVFFVRRTYFCVFRVNSNHTNDPTCLLLSL